MDITDGLTCILYSSTDYSLADLTNLSLACSYLDSRLRDTNIQADTKTYPAVCAAGCVAVYVISMTA